MAVRKYKAHAMQVYHGGANWRNQKPLRSCRPARTVLHCTSASVAQRTEQRFPNLSILERDEVEERLPTLVDWVTAPEWVTPEEAAFLMGRNYDLNTIHELMAIGAFDLRDAPDGGFLIERASLREYQEALLDVLLS